MKKLFSILFIFFVTITNAQEKTEKEPKTQIVEASCGQCQFGMPGHGCDLAVRIENKAYFVEGTHIDKHGDAHAEHGFCETIRQAEVIGKVKNDKFVVTSFKLLPKKEK